MKSVILFAAIAALANAKNCAKGWKLNPKTEKCSYIGLGFDLNHYQCEARCHALHARLPCIEGPQDERFFPDVYPMPQDYPPVRSVHLARTHTGPNKDENFDWGKGCKSSYTNWAPFLIYAPEDHCVTIEYNLQNTDWIILNCSSVTQGIRPLCVCEGEVGEDLLLPAGDSVSPPPYCSSGYFLRNPGNNKCYTDRTSQTRPYGHPCPDVCAAWQARLPDASIPSTAKFLHEHFPGYFNPHSPRCICEQDASYVYFPDPAPGMEQPGVPYPPPPAPFSCPVDYAMDEISAQCVPSEKQGDESIGHTYSTDSAGLSRGQLMGVVVGAVTAVLMLAILLFFVLRSKERGTRASGDIELLQRAVAMLPLRKGSHRQPIPLPQEAPVEDEGPLLADQDIRSQSATIISETFLV